jgi:hypothetical protein
MKNRTQPQEFRKWLACLPERIRDQLVLIPLQAGSKTPAVPRGESWQNPRYHLVPEAAMDRLEAGANVGVVATKSSLAFLDIERKNIRKASDYISKNIIDTLIVKTRDGGLHLHYENISGLPNKDLRVNGTQLIELRADNRYVVAPGSFVPPDEGSKGTGLYHVVNERAPLPLHADDLPWLNEPVEPSQKPTKPVNFDGEFMALPCVKVLFDVKLEHGRKVCAAKLLAIAWTKDKKTSDGFATVARAFTAFQDHPDFRMNWRTVCAWASSVARNRREWSCGEMINLLRDNGVYPPCSGCPMKVEVK